jgi:PHD/YefM family antitoxin component YafN of YafNO toxin-antitoxin module
MEPITAGIRDFRENLATYLVESNGPVAITRHGDTIGYFIPARLKRSEAERKALKEAAAQLDALLAVRGVTEDEPVADFKRSRLFVYRRYMTIMSEGTEPLPRGG